jgi:hypothetical protein
MAQDTVSVPVSLQANGNSPASIQFTAIYPATLDFVGVDAGQSATDAGKTAAAGTPVGGGVKILVTGANTTAVKDGIVALLKFTIRSGNPGDKAAIQITEPVLSTGEEPVAIATECSDGAVVISKSTGCFGGVVMPETRAPQRGDCAVWGAMILALMLASRTRGKLKAERC